MCFQNVSSKVWCWGNWLLSVSLICAQKGQKWCPSNQLLLSSWLSDTSLLNEWVIGECTSNLAVWMTESVCCTSETNTTLQISYTSLKLKKNLAGWICWDITGYLRRKPALTQCLHLFEMGPLKMATLSSAEYMSYQIGTSSQPTEPWETDCCLKPLNFGMVCYRGQILNTRIVVVV